MFFKTNSKQRAFITSLGMNNNELDSLCLRVWLSKNNTFTIGSLLKTACNVT